MVQRFRVGIRVLIEEQIDVQKGQQRILAFIGLQVAGAQGVIGPGEQHRFFLRVVLIDDLGRQRNALFRFADPGQAHGAAERGKQLLLRARAS